MYYVLQIKIQDNKIITKKNIYINIKYMFDPDPWFIKAWPGPVEKSL